MIDCSQFAASLPYLLIDEVETENRAELLAHAEVCEGCGAELRIDQAMRLGLQQISLAQSPECPAALRRNIQRGFRRARIVRVGGSLGGIAAAAAIAAFLLQPTGDPLDPLIDTTIDYQSRRLPADVAFEPPAKVEAFLAQQLGRSVNLPRIEHLPVRGARFMPAQGKRGAVIMLGGGPQRVDVLAVEADQSVSKRLIKPRVTKRDGREVLQWYRDGMVYSATSANGRTPNALFKFANHSR
jgi:anti-sigma factor RsiW